MSRPKFFITDVFTAKKYGGNPLATFFDCESLSDWEMQKIAKEINFSETTFITAGDEAGGFDVRIFTPNAEVEFAGHPTLGTAHVIRHKLRLVTGNEVVLNLRAGKIPVFFDTADGASMLWMKQLPPQFGKRFDASLLAAVLGLAASDFDHAFPVEEVSTGFPTLIVPLKDLAALRRARVNRDAYFALVKEKWAKLILAFSREGYEPVQGLSTRVFADFYGIAEDAATGSANGALAAYLARHKFWSTPKIDVAVGQGYEIGRPSHLALRASDNDGEIEVCVGGSVVEVAEGVWCR